MFTRIWIKYLPIIKILLKRALNGEQVLDLNRIDFEKAGSGRKAGYKFEIMLNNGRVSNVISSSPLASDLATVLLEEPSLRPILAGQQYSISLTTKFQLIIKSLNAAEPAPAAADEIVE